MRGIFVSNAFLEGRKFDEPAAMFGEAAEKVGIDLVATDNSELMSPIGTMPRIGDVDFVLFWDKDVRCARNLEVCGARVFNPSSCIAVCDDKALTHLALRSHGVPSIETMSCPLSFGPYGDLGFLDRASETLGFPMVVKDCFGSFGQQVSLVNDIDGLRERSRGPFVPRILQRYVECGRRDIRVEVVGGRAVAAMSRVAPPGDFRSNATIGGTISAHSPTDEESELAIRACEAVGADFAGVDILRSDEGDVVCEVNSNAHLRNLLDCTGVNAAEIILEHVMDSVRG
ncbi:RimK family alpha-L-glutamate ligase [Candidatus Methanoprimaticola sp. MG2]|uniref:RimK family alpha-L-glutamate ligase n=1 Tax=Candidatus Methanoprimaticola sp. MG2 TaxID=3228838 RepID=UPI0039C6B540